MAPTNIEALTGIVRLDLSARKTPLALQRLDAAAAAPKPSVDLLLAVARGYRTAGQDVKTEAVLTRAIQLDPSRLQGYSLLGQLYARQNRLDEAKRQFEDVLKHDPASVPAQTMIGMIQEGQGHVAEAEKSYERVLAINSRSPVAANNLAWIYVASNRKLEEALKLGQAAFEQLSDEPNVNDTLGWIFVKKDMATRGVPLLETAAQKGPDNPDFRYHLGVAYFKTGNWKKSRTELEKALSLKPKLADAEDARKTLAIVGTSSTQ